MKPNCSCRILLSSVILFLSLAADAQRPSDPALDKEYETADQLFLDGIHLKEGALSNKRAAIAKFKLAVDKYRSIGSLRDAANAKEQIASSYDSLGEYLLAIATYTDLLEFYRSEDNRRLEARTIANIALMHYELGNFEDSRGLLLKALAIERATENPIGLGSVLNNLGAVSFSLGDYAVALDYFQKALSLRQKSDDRRGESATLHWIGSTFAILGQTDKAMKYLFMALNSSRASGDRRRTALVLNDIGLTLFESDRLSEVEGYYDSSLELFRATQDSSGEAQVLHNLAGVYRKQGVLGKAVELYGKSLNIRIQIGDSEGRAATLHRLAETLALRGNDKDTLNLFFQSLRLCREHGFISREAKVLSSLAEFYGSRGLIDISLYFGKQAINSYQHLRYNIRELSKEIRASYARSVGTVYRSVANQLVEQGRIAEAERILELLKEEEYSSFVRRDGSATKNLITEISLSPVEKSAFEEYEKTAGQITSKAAEFAVLDKKKRDLPLDESLSASDQAEWNRLKAQLDNAVVVFAKFVEELKVRFGSNNKQVIELESDSVGLLKTLDEPHTVVISTIAGERTLNLIVTTSEIQTAHVVEIKATDLNKLVAEFRSDVSNPRVDPRPSGRKLYDLLFPAGLKKDLENVNADTIIWSLDGALRYVPISALWDGDSYLAQRYRIGVMTVASRNKLKETTSSSSWQALGVGVSKAVPGEFEALPDVPRELCGIVTDANKRIYCDQYGTGGVFPGKLLPDDEFTQEGFVQLLGRTAVVHIASHFALNPGNESNSYLLLGGGSDRKLTLDKLRKIRLDGVELLTVSACNTAMTSGNNSNGVEVEGFGMIAMNQGARSVIATLWPVADESTQLFMTEFYRLKKDGMVVDGKKKELSKAGAIQLVQQKMISGQIKPSGKSIGCRSDPIGDLQSSPDPFKCDPNAPYTHPFFWAPFVLIGNWR